MYLNTKIIAITLTVFLLSSCDAVDNDNNKDNQIKPENIEAINTLSSDIRNISSKLEKLETNLSSKLETLKKKICTIQLGQD